MLIVEEVEDPHPLNTRILERKDIVATIVFLIILNTILNTILVNLKHLKTSFFYGHILHYNCAIIITET
jgi:hypothetical protein